MIDNTSEIFGPGVRYVPGQIRDLILGSAQVQTIEAITPFAQDPDDTVDGERGNSAFDRRHRLAISFLYDMPSPDSGAARWFFGNWQLNGLITAQSGQPFTPVNGVGACIEANGDGVLTNDRPLIGSPDAPANSVALLLIRPVRPFHQKNVRMLRSIIRVITRSLATKQSRPEWSSYRCDCFSPCVPSQ